MINAVGPYNHVKPAIHHVFRGASTDQVIGGSMSDITKGGPPSVTSIVQEKVAPRVPVNSSVGNILQDGTLNSIYKDVMR